MIDMRREHALHMRSIDRLQPQMGESVVWFVVDAESSYHPIYDDYGRNFKPGVIVPFLWIDQVEDPNQYTAEGVRPTNRFKGAVTLRTLGSVGVPVNDAHYDRLIDPEITPTTDVTNNRNNDILYYDKRFWQVSNFQIRGRMQSVDNMVGVSAIEIKRDELGPLTFPSEQVRILPEDSL